MDRKISILFVSRSAGMYGAQRSLVELIKGLKERGCECFALISEHGALCDALEEMRVEYIIAPFKNWLYTGIIPAKAPFRVALNALACRKIEKAPADRHVDLVYTNTIVSPFGAMLARRLGKPHIWHIREYFRDDLGAKFDFGTKYSMRFINKSSEMIICNSNSTRDKMAAFIPSDKLSVVYNGILSECDIESGKLHVEKRKHPAEKSDVTLCIVGLITKNKGHEDAIRALNALKNRGINARLKIVGDAHESYRKKLVALSKSLSVADRIIWEGWRADPLSVYLSSDICLVCSRHESFGRVAVEAMAAGCPVISTGAGGQREIISNGENGLFYSAGDYESLASRIERLIKDETLYHAIVNNAFSSVCERFSTEKYISGIHHIIEDCLNSV